MIVGISMGHEICLILGQVSLSLLDLKKNLENCEGSLALTPRIRKFKETIKNARKKLETSVAPALPCKIMKIVGVVHPTKLKTKLA